MTNAVEYISQHEVSSNNKDSKTKKNLIYFDRCEPRLVIMNIRYFNYEIKKVCLNTTCVVTKITNTMLIMMIMIIT